MFETDVHPLNARTVTGGENARYRIGILLAMFVAALVGLFLLEPISQSAAYHGFVDTRSWLGIPNFGDVVSNVPFAIAGGFGLWQVLGPASRQIFDNLAERWPYAFFFIGVGLVSVGSAYYHVAPGNDRLFWDRL